MILKLKRIQLCLNGAELASIRLEYYQSYGTLFEHPPQKLHQIIDIKEDLKTLGKEYFDLFIYPSNKYVFPFKSVHKKGKGQQKGLSDLVIKNMEDQKSKDHLLFSLNQMCSLIKKEKRHWQRKNYLIAMNLLYQEQNYLLDQLDWLLSLCVQIQKNTTTDFYNDVALNLRNFLLFERLLLEQLLLKRTNILN